MTKQETERLSRLEQQVARQGQQLKDMARQLNENSSDTKAIRATLDNLTGGKQALMWFTGFTVSVLIVIATWLGFHK